MFLFFLILAWTGLSAASISSKSDYCPSTYHCMETVSGSQKCCLHKSAVPCGETHCCPADFVCTEDGFSCVKERELVPSSELIRPEDLESQCESANTRLKKEVKNVIEMRSWEAIQGVITAYQSEKDFCQKTLEGKLRISPGSCMVDFLLFETDTRVTWWSLTGGNYKDSLSAFLRVMMWIPYMNADCLA